MSEAIKNYYQGIYLTETILGNPNGDFVDNSPRNIDGKVFTTDKCIKYNVRKYIHENIEDNDEVEDFVFFYPRHSKDTKKYESKFMTKDTVFEKHFEKHFDRLIDASIDVRMFGGTFSFGKDPKQIYGPIQISYGKDINDAQIKRLQIGSPFPTKDDRQKTIGSEAVVDDAIISYDLTINPNNYPDLLKMRDFNIFKRSLWYGTNLRKSTSKKTDSKLLILIKFSNKENESNANAINMGELKELISIKNKEKRKKNLEERPEIVIKTSLLEKKLSKYKEFIDEISLYYDKDEIEIEFKELTDKIIYLAPEKLLSGE